MTIVDFKKKSLEKKNKEFQRVTNLTCISIGVDHFTKKKKKKKRKSFLTVRSSLSERIIRSKIDGRII